MKPKFLTTLVLFTLLNLNLDIFAAEVNYQANNCEIFVDKIGYTYSSFGSVQADLYIKVLPERLDSYITQVGFHGIKYRDGNESEYGWHDYNARAYKGSTDYYRIVLLAGTNYAKHEWFGAFFVETEKGTRYWLNADRNTPNTWYNLFHIHRVTSDSLEYILPMPSYHIDNTAATHEHFTEFNPQRCY